MIVLVGEYLVLTGAVQRATGGGCITWWQGTWEVQERGPSGHGCGRRLAHGMTDQGYATFEAAAVAAQLRGVVEARELQANHGPDPSEWEV